jgi:hypothetical protein
VKFFDPTTTRLECEGAQDTAKASTSKNAP